MDAMLSYPEKLPRDFCLFDVVEFLVEEVAPDIILELLFGVLEVL